MPVLKKGGPEMPISEMTANQFRNEGNAFADDERGNA
jgi:hypothetical protein